MQRLTLRAGLAAFLAAAIFAPAASQSGAGDPSSALAAAMRTLAKEPRNMEALVSAGRASLELGDLQAAAGFFGRAEEAFPRSPLPKIGMGATMTMSGQPSSALTYFARAAALGAPPSMLALDRGMAYDLLGQQPQAQAEYRLAMIGPSADEARRRLALSLAIARDIKGAAATIEPLLQRRDREAIRVNAFILALAGDREGARRTIDSVAPGKGAQFEPFFRMLPVLRANEKAAAVHLGEFPSDAAQRFAQAQPIAPSPVQSVGNSGEPAPTTSRIAQRQAAATAARTQPPPVRRADPPKAARSEPPRSEPRRAEREVTGINTWIASVRPSLDPSRRPASRRPAAKPQKEPSAPAVTSSMGTSGASNAVSSEPLVTRTLAEPEPVETVALGPAPASSEPEPAPVETAPAVSNATIDLPPDPLRPADNDEEPRPGFAAVADSPPPAPTPKLEGEAPPAPRPKVELAANDSGKRRSETRTARTAERDVGATGTYWVQLAGSGNKAMMAAEFKKIRGKNPELFKGQPGHVTVGKDYFRLLVGPFETAAAAQAFVTRLDKAGIDSFAWTRNPAEIKIEKLASR